MYSNHMQKGGGEGRKGSGDKACPSTGQGWNAGVGVSMQSVTTSCTKRASQMCSWVRFLHFSGKEVKTAMQNGKYVVVPQNQ